MKPWTLEQLAQMHIDFDKKRIEALLSGDSNVGYQYLAKLYNNAQRASSQGFTLEELFKEMARLGYDN